MRSFVLLVLLVGVALADELLPSQEDADIGLIDYQNSVSKDPKCGPNQKFSQCEANPLCQRTCANANDGYQFCPLYFICMPGCVCKKGYVRTMINGRCIHKSMCPEVILKSEKSGDRL